MVAVQFIIVFIIIGFIVGTTRYFFYKNKEIEQAHRFRVELINKTISLQKEQINFRIKSLQGYDFLKYNLNESLILQPEIKPI